MNTQSLIPTQKQDIVRKSSATFLANFAVLASVPFLALVFLLSQGRSIAASLFADAPPELKTVNPSNPTATLQKNAYVHSKYGAAIASILDNWEYTTHCIGNSVASGCGDCANATCGGGTLLTTCGTLVTNVASFCGAAGGSANCGAFTGANQACAGCCVGF